MIAGALAATQPEAAAIIQGAAEAYVAESPNFARLTSLIVTEALGEEHARELRAPAVPTWTGTTPSPTPLPRSHKPSTNPNRGPSHERVRAGRRTPGADPACLPLPDVIVPRVVQFRWLFAQEIAATTAVKVRIKSARPSRCSKSAVEGWACGTTHTPPPY